MRLIRHLPLLLLVATGPVSAASINFHVSDQTDPAEITEATTVFVNGQLVAHFELSAEHPFAEVSVNIPAAGRCETHVLDDGATMPDPSGRHLEALASDGFTTFFLAERRGEGAPPPSDLHKTNACSIPIS